MAVEQKKKQKQVPTQKTNDVIAIVVQATILGKHLGNNIVNRLNIRVGLGVGLAAFSCYGMNNKSKPKQKKQKNKKMVIVDRQQPIATKMFQQNVGTYV